MMGDSRADRMKISRTPPASLARLESILPHAPHAARHRARRRGWRAPSAAGVSAYGLTKVDEKLCLHSLLFSHRAKILSLLGGLARMGGFRRREVAVRFGSFEVDPHTQNCEAGVCLICRTKLSTFTASCFWRSGELVPARDSSRDWPVMSMWTSSMGEQCGKSPAVALGDSAQQGRYIETVSETGLSFRRKVVELIHELNQPSSPDM